MPIVHTSRLAVLSLIASIAIAHVASAEAPTPTTQPLRTIAVVGTGEAKYQLDIDEARKKATATSYDAALADAKQTAERAAKVLGVHLGSPVTVDAPASGGKMPVVFDPDARPTFSTIESSVRIVFELVP